MKHQFDLGTWIGRLPKSVRVLLVVCSLATLLILNRFSLLSSKEIRWNNAVVQAAEVVYVPENHIVNLLSLGYDQVAADMLWIRTLNYFSRHFDADRKYEWLEHFLDQILHFDPKFRRVYHWAGANVLYGRQFINKNVMISSRFYELALEHFPNDYEAAYRLGLNYYVEMKSDDADERDRWRRIGLSYLEMAANIPEAPDSIRTLVAGVSRRLGRSQLAVQYLIDIYLRTENEEKRAALKVRIAQLQGEGTGQSDLAAAAERFNTHWRKQFNYISPEVFSLMGEPTGPQQVDVDWHTLLPDVNVRSTAGEHP